MPSFLRSGSSMHHHWVSALKHTKIHFRKETTASSLAIREPWHVLTGSKWYVSLIYMYICDVSIYICLNFVSWGLIPNFMPFVFRRPKTKQNKTKPHKHTGKKGVLWCFWHLFSCLFLSRFFNCSLPDRVLIEIGLYQKEESSFRSSELRCRDSS